MYFTYQRMEIYTTTLSGNSAKWGSDAGGYPVYLMEKTDVTYSDYSYLGTLSAESTSRRFLNLRETVLYNNYLRENQARILTSSSEMPS